MAKKVEEIMTPNPRTVTRSTPIGEAARLMRDEDVGSLPVVNDAGELVGIVTDRDITVRIVAESRSLDGVTVADAATDNPVAVSPEDDLDVALHAMERHQLRRLPVVVNDVQLVGIVAQADLALELKEKKAGELVEEISRPTTIGV